MSHSKLHPSFLALDLGAESGRAILGSLDGDKLSLSEIHRFANGPVRLPDGLHWDVLRLWTEIKAGLALAAGRAGDSLAGVGLDTWGVDFGLLDERDRLIANPYHYRDSRTDGMLEEAFLRVPRRRIFESTGIQFMALNTLYQLLALNLHDPGQLQAAKTLLMTPDLFNYWLTRRKASEFTIATTTQCFDPQKMDWARPLLEKMGLPTDIFPEVVPPGTILGPVAGYLVEELGTTATVVVAPACHDTGSAVAAVPAENSRFAWISSGTWSIIGVEAHQPIINDQILNCNFTNEGGVCGTWRLSRTMTGLWLVQECRRTWAAQGEELSYDELTSLASVAEPFRAVLDPEDETFLRPGDMPARVREYCRKTGQAVPEDKGAILRCILESLSLKYRWILEKLEEFTGCRLEPVHIIGGGAKNRLLDQFTADATGRTCIAGPVEATAIGNILMQALALGWIGSLHQARAIVRGSFAPETFAPGEGAGWDEAYQRLLEVMQTHD